MMKIAKNNKEQRSFETGIRQLRDDELACVTGGHKNDVDTDLIDADVDIRIDPKINL